MRLYDQASKGSDASTKRTDRVNTGMIIASKEVLDLKLAIQDGVPKVLFLYVKLLI